MLKAAAGEIFLQDFVSFSCENFWSNWMWHLLDFDPCSLAPVISVPSLQKNILPPLVYFSLITNIFVFLIHQEACTAPSRHRILSRPWTMGVCSLLWSFQNQALGSCHVFIFLNTPTGTPPWLPQARGLERLFIVCSWTTMHRALSKGDKLWGGARAVP